jgi:tetratricopeptide (TPR) repeat protein
MNLSIIFALLHRRPTDHIGPLVTSFNHPLGALALAAVVGLAGCLGAQSKANQTQLEQQQTQLDQLKEQVVALQTQRATNGAAYPAAGACDDAVMREASRKGGQRFAAGDFTHALPYYQDAVAACPKNAKAQLNLAQTFEANGDRPEARAHYRLAADATGGGADRDIASQARDALVRLQTSGSHEP